MLSTLEQIKHQNKVCRENVLKYGKMVDSHLKYPLKIEEIIEDGIVFIFTRCGYHGELFT